MNEEALARWKLLRQKKKKIITTTPRNHFSSVNFIPNLIYIAKVFLTLPTTTITVFRDVTLFRLLDIGLPTTRGDCTLLVAATAGALMCLSHHKRHIPERQLPHFTFIVLFYTHFEISLISQRITSWNRVVFDKLMI